MSRTRRIYNKIRRSMYRGNIMGVFYHPYIEWCCGNCRYCRRYKMKENNQRKTKQEREFRELLRDEHVSHYKNIQ